MPWKIPPQAGHKQQNQVLREKIKKIFTASGKTCGARRKLSDRFKPHITDCTKPAGTKVLS